MTQQRAREAVCVPCGIDRFISMTQTVLLGLLLVPLTDVLPQAELCLDLRVCCNPNDLFYCGDTCPTIARGIGFR